MTTTKGIDIGQLLGGVDPWALGSLDQNETSRRGELLQQKFGTQAFLDAGKDGGVWFSISPEVKAFIIADADDGAGQAIVDRMEQLMGRLNAFLRRPDVSEAMKMKLMDQLLGHATAAYDDVEDREFGDQWACLGTVVAEVMSGNPRVISEVFDSDLTNEALDLDALTSMVASFDDHMTKLLNDNKVAVEPDKSMAYLSTLSLVAEAEAKRRKGLTGGDLMAEISRQRAERAEDIEKRKREWADHSPQRA